MTHTHRHKPSPLTKPFLLPFKTHTRAFGRPQEFAADGLRTLCLAVAQLTQAQYDEWAAVYASAATALVNRSQRMNDAAELVRCDLCSLLLS